MAISTERSRSDFDIATDYCILGFQGKIQPEDTIAVLAHFGPYKGADLIQKVLSDGEYYTKYDRIQAAALAAILYHGSGHIIRTYAEEFFGMEYLHLSTHEKRRLHRDIAEMMVEEELSFKEATQTLQKRIQPASLQSYIDSVLAKFDVI